MRINLSQSLKILLIAAILGAFSSSTFAYTPEIKADWQEYRSDHFIIHYHPGIPNKYIREFTRKCEQYYYLIAERLGLRRFDFWSWEKRARIFIYPTRQEYIKERNRPAGSLASVQVKRKTISTFYCEQGLADTIMAHEITHLVFREVIGLDTQLPLWFEEGVACVNEGGGDAQFLLATQYNLEKIADLDNLDKGQFYLLCASLITFLLENYDQEYFRQFCHQLGEQRSFYEAMTEIYGIKDVQDLQQKFLAFCHRRNPA